MINNNIKISVIVPIYNVGNYLRKCIDSLIFQKYTNIEIILATDGPVDCDKICEEYLKKDLRCKIIWYPGSYGKACNKGIKTATGDYIGIVESDDWCSLEMFGKLAYVANTTHADIIKAGFVEVSQNGENTKKYFCRKDSTFSIEERPYILGFQPSVWSAIYRKEFLMKNNIFFIEDKMPFVDAPFTYKSFLSANKIAGVPECLYFYYLGNQNQSVKDPKSAFYGIKAEYLFYKELDIKKISRRIQIELLKATEDHLKWDSRLLINLKDEEDFNILRRKFWEFILNKFKDEKIYNMLSRRRMPEGILDSQVFESLYQNGKRKFKIFGKTVFSYKID